MRRHAGARVEREPSLHVLNAATAARIARVNEAMRALRNMEIRVIQHSLAGIPPVTCAPVVRIERDPTRSIAPLLDKAGARTFGPEFDRDGRTVRVVSAPFMAVYVMWEEAL